MEKLIPPVNAVYVLLGVVFVIAALSLLVSIIMEMVALILNTRAKTLLSAIRELFQEDKKLFEEFTRHPRFRQIVGGAKGLTGTPRYLPGDSFADICLEILQLRGLAEGESAVLSDVKALDTFLKLQFEDCHRDAAAFQTFLERWYNDKMDFAWERYQRQVKYWLFFISLFVAILFNADLIGVYSRLSASLQSSPVEVMNSVTNNLDKLITFDSTLRDAAAVKNIESKLLTLMEQSLEPRESNILGWSGAYPGTPAGWLVQFAGFVISALLLSYGAQLWFDWIRKKFK
jgi:hypothetical protein